MFKRLSIIAISVLVASCAAKKQPTLEPIIQTNGKFCEIEVPQSVVGGMYRSQSAHVQFVGNCYHQLDIKQGMILIYIGDYPNDLLEDLDYYLHPDQYYTPQEMAEINCAQGSQCQLKKLAEEQRLLEAQRKAEFIRAQLKNGLVVNFKSGSAEPLNSELISQIASLAGNEKVTIVVIGHADADGGNEFNKKLSIRRAERIREILSESGLNPDLIKIEGRGESEPIASNKTREGKAKNRRAVIKGETDGNAN